MKLLDYFDAFLTNTVNLNQSRLDELNAHVDAIVVAIGLDDVIGPIFVEHIPQGSWAHQTIIKPLPDHEFDADFLLRLEEQADWGENPRRYITEVNAAFGRTRYKDMLELHTRCVRVIFAHNCHVDVVPYVVRADGSQVIVNRRDNAFEETNPQGFTDWMKEKDDLAKRNLRRVIRLIKYLRDYKVTFQIPSVILTAFLGERVQSWQADKRYGDVPSALLNLVSDLDQWLQLYETMPIIEDPSCPGTTFNHRWTEARYGTFRDRIHRYADQIRAAYDERDRDASLALWQEIFGPDFKTAPAAESESAKAIAIATEDRAPEEEFIEERGYSWAVTRKARIDARLEPKAGFRHGPLRTTPVVGKDRWIRFEVKTDAPPPYEVLWKVRNHGDEAARASQLRGEIRPGRLGPTTHRESTRYRGRHYVEAYVIKERRVVASDRHDVAIG
jgi:hypothetical protein